VIGISATTIESSARGWHCGEANESHRVIDCETDLRRGGRPNARCFRLRASIWCRPRRGSRPSRLRGGLPSWHSPPVDDARRKRRPKNGAGHIRTETDMDLHLQRFLARQSRPAVSQCLAVNMGRLRQGGTIAWLRTIHDILMFGRLSDSAVWSRPAGIFPFGGLQEWR
jgi:hypothetical protein